MKSVLITVYLGGIIILICLNSNAHAKSTVRTSSNTDRTILLTGKSQFVSNVFHNETERHYFEYERGPCGKLMWIVKEHPGSTYGVCRCIQTPLGLRPITYWQPTNRCYFGYDQGPCEENKWLILNSETQTVECQNNPCFVPKLKGEMDDADLESLVALETEYRFIDNDTPTTCLKNKIDLRSWHFRRESARVSRFLFHNESQKFYPVGERGPCAILMEIQKEHWPADNYGVCRCKSIGPEERPILYWNATNRCYFGFHQGPCEKGEWLVGDGGGATGGVCKKSNCTMSPLANSEDDGDSQVLKSDKKFFIQSTNGSCHQTNTQAFCQDQHNLFLNFDAVTADCHSVGPNGKFKGYSLALSGTQSCEEGFMMDENNKCVKSAIFD